MVQAPTAGNGFDDLLDRFEQAWQQGAPPAIEDYLKSHPTSEPARRELVAELVKIDLGHRWRLKPAGSKPWTLEDYVRRYPELGPLPGQPLDLIGEEYWARQRWGDRPPHHEYLARFPRPGSALREALVRIDRELAQEFAKQPESAAIRALPAGGSLPRAGPASVADVLTALEQCQLLNSTQRSQLRNGRFRDSRALARELLRQNWLTPFQVNQLMQGKGPELRFGPYLVLERLGEGGAGQVFKARHERTGRLVALKLIRRELLVDPEVVGRFQREIQILSQLDHPNIVQAYDSGAAGAGHYLAMEYVEGTDLGRLVKHGGPMPVQQACEYIRQAARGLQHAHECGLVHRDIKPHNLIMSVRGGLIKVADLGLARLPRTVNEDGGNSLTTAAKSTGTLTPENAGPVGTADYLAPEQALDFHQADIRADIYSLGCTLYFLLTGQPPFPGGGLAQKLANHLHTEPPGVDRQRQDLPPGLSNVIRKMLAKRPEERYQTPVEVANVLAPLAAGASLRSKWSAGLPITPKKRRAALILGALIGLTLLLLWFRGEGELTEPRKVDQLHLKKQDHLHPVAFSGNGKLVASGGGDALISVWDPWADPQTDRQLFTLAGHKDGISHLAVSPDGRHLASGSGDKTWKLWDLKAQREVFSGQADPATRLHVTRPFVGPFAPNGKVVAICHGEGTVSLVDPAGKEVTRFHLKELPLALAFSPDSRSLALVSGRLVIYDIVSGKELVSGSAGGYVSALAFSPDGTRLAVARLNHEVQLLDAGMLKPLWTDQLSVPRALPSRSPVVFLTFSPDSKILACGGWDHQVTVWDVDTGKERFTFAAVDSYTKPICGMAMSPDGRTLFVGAEDDIVRVWRVR